MWVVVMDSNHTFILLLIISTADESKESDFLSKLLEFFYFLIHEA